MELKPCPFCGGKPRTKGATYNPKGYYGKVCFGLEDKHWYGVYCTQCHVGQPIRTYHEKEEAITAWNTRTKGE